MSLLLLCPQGVYKPRATVDLINGEISYVGKLVILFWTIILIHPRRVLEGIFFEISKSSSK